VRVSRNSIICFELNESRNILNKMREFFNSEGNFLQEHIDFVKKLRCQYLDDEKMMFFFTTMISKMQM
jgi:hypothetical protein